MNLIDSLLRSAGMVPDRPAIAVGARVALSYRELASRVARLSSSLRSDSGLVPGDRVALVMRNGPEYFVILFACWHAGLVAVPINAKLHAKEIAYIIGNSGAKLCFVSPDLEADVPGSVSIDSKIYSDMFATDSHSPAHVRPEDPAWLFYTSGTTGVPKGATLTHRNLAFQSQAYFTDIDALTPEDAILHAAPLSHGSGLYSLPHFAAGAVNIIPESGHFEPDEIFALLDHWQNVSFFAAPTMIVKLLASNAARRPRNLKTIVYGGAPMYVADCTRAIELFGPRLFQLYGQGESPMTITGLPQFLHRPEFTERLSSCGFARTGVEVRVVDEHDLELLSGEVGEVITRSDCMMTGYWENLSPLRLLYAAAGCTQETSVALTAQAS